MPNMLLMLSKSLLELDHFASMWSILAGNWQSVAKSFRQMTSVKPKMNLSQFGLELIVNHTHDLL